MARTQEGPQALAGLATEADQGSPAHSPSPWHSRARPQPPVCPDTTTAYLTVSFLLFS